MPVLKLVEPDSKILSTPAEAVGRKNFTKSDNRIISDMMKTLASLEDAIALAAPQVGISLRIFVVKSKSEMHAVIDPKVIWTSVSDPNEIILGKHDEPIPRVTSFWERCLSFPNEEFLAYRPYIATISFRNEKGVSRKISYQAWPARVVLHEMSHLEGILPTDNCESSRSTNEDTPSEIWRF